MLGKRTDASLSAGGPTASRPGRLPQGLSAFQHRNYRLYFSGQLISVTGTWMQTIAQSWLVLTLTSSALLFSLVSVLQFLPVLVLSPLAGVVADRLPKRELIIVTQSVACLCATTMVTLVATGRIQLWHIYLLASILGVNNAFDMPTRQAFVVDMVGKEDLVNAIALNSTLFNVGRIIGPSMAGLLMAWKGAAWCFGIDAVSYLAVIFGLTQMRNVPSVARLSGRGLQQMREGVAYIRSRDVLLLPILIAGFVGAFGMNFNVWIPLLAKNEFKVGADGFGILMAAVGIGSLVGALYLAFHTDRPRPRTVVYSGLMLGAVELGLAFAAAVPLSVAVALVMLPFMGFAMSSTGAMANTLVQTSSPEEMRGRVMAAYMALAAGAAPAGSFLMGALANSFGTPMSILVGGAATVISSIAIGWKFNALQNSRRTTRGAAAAD
jgi:predicted MFS family arabinose efflux permease